MGLYDFMEGLGAILKKKFPNVQRSLESINRLTTSTFLLKLVNYEKQVDGNGYGKIIVNLDLVYLPHQAINADLYKMIDALDDALKPTIPIKDRFLFLGDTETRIMDNDLHYMMTVEFYDMIDKIDEAYMMQLFIKGE